MDFAMTSGDGVTFLRILKNVMKMMKRRAEAAAARPTTAPTVNCGPEKNSSAALERSQFAQRSMERG